MYQSVNPAVMLRVPVQAATVLDIGCGGGALGTALKARAPCSVTGITHDEEEAALARRTLDRIVVADLNQFDPRPLGLFDCVVCSHVLEHLLWPQRLLLQLRDCIAPRGRLIVALPNALFWKQRVEFLRGRFRYTEGGLMDRTHLRFFDWHSAARLLGDNGFEVQERFADGHLPLSGRLGRDAGAQLDRWSLRTLPGLFAHQFVLSSMPMGEMPEPEAAS